MRMNHLPAKTLNAGVKAQIERTVARFFVANGVPGFRWDTTEHRFRGVFGYQIGRASPRSHGGMAKVVPRMRALGPHPVMVVTSRHWGDTVDESVVLMRLADFAPIFAHWVTSDPERYIEKGQG